MRAEFDKAKNAGRTAQSFEEWRTDFITQSAVSWVLECVFVRFIEDNQLLDDPQQPRAWLSGSGERLQLAQDRHTTYFHEHPTESDREYLQAVFHSVGNPTGKRPIAVVQALYHPAGERTQGGNLRRHPGAAEISIQGFPRPELLAVARQAGRAERTLRQLPALRTRG